MISEYLLEVSVSAYQHNFKMLLSMSIKEIINNTPQDVKYYKLYYLVKILH